MIVKFTNTNLKVLAIKTKNTEAVSLSISDNVQIMCCNESPPDFVEMFLFVESNYHKKLVKKTPLSKSRLHRNETM